MRATSATAPSACWAPRSQGEWVRLNGRSMRVFAYPIGIDAEAFSRDAERAVNDKVVQRLAGSLIGRALAIGVDRMDYSKGLPQRFEAYARLLEKHPEHHRKVHLLQICPRSREEVDEYRKLRCGARPAGRPHQRPLLGLRLDAAALLDARRAALDPGRSLSDRPRSAWSRRCATA